jgi:hypothetical protein
MSTVEVDFGMPRTKTNKRGEEIRPDPKSEKRKTKREFSRGSGWRVRGGSDNK